MNRVLSCIMALSIIISTVIFSPVYASEGAENSGTIYYVDQTTGNDENNGTSEDTPWKTLDKVNNTVFQPGDQILLKCGETWTEQLAPKGSGTNEAPIILSSYGTGDRPRINPTGGVSGLNGGAVLLYNQQYWEISNLEVVNTGASNADRSGIRVRGDNGTTLNHIYISNCFVHDVNGIQGQQLESDLYPERTGDYKVTHRNGGINVFADNYAGTTTFNDVRITGNEIHDCAPNGISTINPGAGWESTQQYNTNTYIAHNYIENVSRSGIILLFDNAGLIEYNTIDTFQTLPGGYGCAIWHGRVVNNITQFNEARNGQGTSDGMAWNCDNASYGTIVQYNYSHDNAGGWIMMHSSKYGNSGNIFRYNLSVNDGSANGPLITTVTTYSMSDNWIYNNTIFSDKAVQITYNPSGFTFANNILSTTKSNIYYATSKNCTYTNNAFYGAHPASEPNDPNKVTEDPMLLFPGNAVSGNNNTYGYVLKSGSPCINAGTVIENNGGRDFWGNEVSATLAPSIGAYNGAGIDAQPQEELIFENETLSEAHSGGTVTVIQDAAASGGAMSRFTAETGDYIEYTFTVPEEGTYYVQTRYKDGPSKGIFETAVDGVVLGSNIDEYGAGTNFINANHGAFDFSAGEHTIRYTVNGKSSQSSGYILVFDKITLSSLKYEAENSVIGHSPNATLSVIESTGASNGKLSRMDTDAAGEYVDYYIYVPAEGTYTIQVRYKDGPAKGECKLSLQGTEIGGIIDQFGAGTNYIYDSVGSYTFTDPGIYTIRFTVSGKNEQSAGMALTFDYFELSAEGTNP